MQIKIELPSDLEQVLIYPAEQANIPLQTLILQALCQIIDVPSPRDSQWSAVVLSYKGNPDFPAFESYRDELPPHRCNFGIVCFALRLSQKSIKLV